MITVGFDLDGVISLLPFGCKPMVLKTQLHGKIIWRLQKFWPLQRFYNHFLRIANPEIRTIIKELKYQSFRVIIVSANSENYREELEKWLIRNGFYFDKLCLRTNPAEDPLTYKRRVVPLLCHYFLDDRNEIVDCINGSTDSKCKALLYQGYKKEELLTIFKTV